MNVSINLLVEILYHLAGISFVYLLSVMLRFGEELTKKSEVIMIGFVIVIVTILSLILHGHIRFV